jgi:hypothetical protein
MLVSGALGSPFAAAALLYRALLSHSMRRTERRGAGTRSPLAVILLLVYRRAILTK